MKQSYSCWFSSFLRDYPGEWGVIGDSGQVERTGWIMKCPFFTNSKEGLGRRFASTYKEVLHGYGLFCKENLHLGYIMLQPRMANRTVILIL